jgi:hypothetical protein
MEKLIEELRQLSDKYYVTDDFAGSPTEASYREGLCEAYSDAANKIERVMKNEN